MESKGSEFLHQELSFSNFEFGKKDKKRLKEILQIVLDLQKRIKGDVLVLLKELRRNQKSLTELRESFNQRQKSKMKTPEMLAILALRDEKEDEVGKLKEEYLRAWKKITIQIPTLPNELLAKMPKGVEIAGLINQFKNEQEVKSRYHDKPLDLFIDIDKLKYALQTTEREIRMRELK